VAWAIVTQSRAGNDEACSTAVPNSVARSKCLSKYKVAIIQWFPDLMRILSPVVDTASDVLGSLSDTPLSTISGLPLSSNESPFALSFFPCLKLLENNQRLTCDKVFCKAPLLISKSSGVNSFRLCQVALERLRIAENSFIFGSLLSQFEAFRHRN
jgi:hypothetical protein